MIDKTFQDYVEEIEGLKKVFNLDSSQILMLQIAAAVKVDNLDYDKLKLEFINKNAKETTNSNNP